MSVRLPPTIDPVESVEAARPFWSVMIPTYNGDPRVAEALESVLAQDPGAEAMQIEVVDDHSSEGDTRALVRRIAGDRVAFYRQPRNVGHSANFNTCIRRARGRIVHILHDDDAVRPGFYERLEAPLREHPEIGAAFTRTIYTDADGHWRSFSPIERSTPGIVDDWPYRIASGNRTTTPAVVVPRATYEAIGGYDEHVKVGGEDWEMWVRISTRSQVWFDPAPLALYRMRRPGSLTGTAQGSTALARDMLALTATIADYLPANLGTARAEAAVKQARNVYAGWAAEAAYDLWIGQQRKAAFGAGRLAWRASSPSTLLKVLVRRHLASRTGRRRGV